MPDSCGSIGAEKQSQNMCLMLVHPSLHALSKNPVTSLIVSDKHVRSIYIMTLGQKWQSVPVDADRSQTLCIKHGAVISLA